MDYLKGEQKNLVTLELCEPCPNRNLYNVTLNKPKLFSPATKE